MVCPRRCGSVAAALAACALTVPAAGTGMPSRQQTPPVQLLPSYNQAFGVVVPKGNSTGGTVRFLATAATTSACAALCAAHGPERCWSFVHFPPAAGAPPSLSGQCFAVLTPGLNPSYDITAVSGVLEWPCRDDDDCSLNGVCGAGGACECRPAWSGRRCGTLNLLPAVPGAGYNGSDNGCHTSSWGGAVLRGSDGTYHMWAAEMTEHCGIGAWQQNSRVVHATSPTPGGVYTRQSVTWEVFSHEPEVVPAPGGVFVMFFTADLRSEHGECNCCRPGQGPCDGSTGPGDCPGGSRASGDVSKRGSSSDGSVNSSTSGQSFGATSSSNTSASNASTAGGGASGAQRPLPRGPRVGSPSWMSHTTDPNGNWSDPVQLFAGYKGSDTNFAPLILPNGSVLAMWRRWGGGNGGSRIFLATADDWTEPASYTQFHDELFPDLGMAGTEDQFLYQDDNGNFHAVFHHMYGTGTKTQWWLDATGGHAFSRDGWRWTYTGVAWGNATARYNTPSGQGATVPCTDGTAQKFTRLERPHLIFESNELKGDPIYLVNSAQYGNGTNPGVRAHNDDACKTLVRPVRQA